MTNYKFDGVKLKFNGKTVANVRGDKVCKDSGATALANIRGTKVCERTGSKTLFNVRGDKICEGTSSKKIADMDDVRDAIDGPGGITLAALWYCFIK